MEHPSLDTSVIMLQVYANDFEMSSTFFTIPFYSSIVVEKEISEMKCRMLVLVFKLCSFLAETWSTRRIAAELEQQSLRTSATLHARS
jgi:hypothetical protein